MLKIGVIGCGKITQVRHAPEYDENPNCELTAWYDFIPERAQEMAQKYGGTVYASIDELLASKPDAVSVCVANADHCAVTIKALEAGCHVLCEKPMATTVEDCLKMIEAANKTGKRLMIGHNQRLNASHAEARRMIAAGEIGRVLSFHTMFGHPGPEGWTGLQNSWFFDKSRAVFGAMADLGIHKTDLIHFLLDDAITDVTAMLGTVDKKYPDGSPISVDDNALCVYRTKGGAIGQMHVSWTNYGQEDNSTRVYGTEGVIRLYDDPEYSLIVEKRNGEVARYKLDEMTTNKKQTGGARSTTHVIDTYIDALLENKRCVLDATDVIKAMYVIFAADQSAKEGRSIHVSEND